MDFFAIFHPLHGHSLSLSANHILHFLLEEPHSIAKVPHFSIAGPSKLIQVFPQLSPFGLGEEKRLDYGFEVSLQLVLHQGESEQIGVLHGGQYLFLLSLVFHSYYL